MVFLAPYPNKYSTNIMEGNANEDSSTSTTVGEDSTANASNINSSEIDADTASKLRGDAIGDTMYSEVFVLKTLMQFSDLQWSKAIETDLCVLWDMTEEKDICEYLFKSSYPSIACGAIVKYSENNRFVEIAIGIFANLLCSKGRLEQQLKQEEIQTILNVLNSDDALILIQVARFIHALVYSCENLKFVANETIEKLCFILTNSVNKQLVLQSLKTLASLTADFKIEESLINSEILKAGITGYQLLVNEESNQSESTEFEDKGDDEENARIDHFATKHFVEIVRNICAYIDNSNKEEEWKLEFKKYLPDLTTEIITILQRFSVNVEDFKPIPDEFKFCLEAFSYIFRVLVLSYNPKMLKVVTTIVSTFIGEDTDDLKFPSELFCYLIAVGDSNRIQADLEKEVPVKEIEKLLKTLTKKNFTYDFDYMANFKELLKSYE